MSSAPSTPDISSVGALALRDVATRYLLAASCVLLCVGVVAPGSTQMLAMVPSNTGMVNYYFWNLLTSAFFDNRPVVGALCLLGLVLAGPQVSQALGALHDPLHMLKFVAVVTVCANGSSFLLYIFYFYQTQDETVLAVPLFGMPPLLAAFAVVFKQHMADVAVLPWPPLNSVKWRHMPSILFLFGCVAWSQLGPGNWSSSIVFFIIDAWLYLRFFYDHPQTQMVGDLRPDFALDTFFPPVIRPIVALLSFIVFKFLLTVGCCHQALRSEHSSTLPTTVSSSKTSSSSASHFAMPLNPTTNPIAERRRALAIKAIDDKIAELSKNSTAAPLFANPAAASATALSASPPAALMDAAPSGTDEVRAAKGT